MYFRKASKAINGQFISFYFCACTCQGFGYVIILYLLCSHNVLISIRYYCLPFVKVRAADLVTISDITKAV